MRFKVGNTDVNISFSFFAVLLMMIAGGRAELYIITFAFSLLHEAVHLIFLFAFGASVKKISFSIFGGNIEREKTSISYKKEAVINLSAPFVNIIIGIALLPFDLLKETAYVNLLLGIFNLLPFYNFDGGKGIENLLLIRFNGSTADRVIFITSLTSVTVFFMLNFAIIYHNKINFILVVINIYMLTCFIVNIFKKSNFKV